MNLCSFFLGSRSVCLAFSRTFYLFILSLNLGYLHITLYLQTQFQLSREMWREVLIEYCVSAPRSFFLTPLILSQTFCSQSVKTLGGWEEGQGAVSDLGLWLHSAGLFGVQTRCVIIWSGCMSWSLQHVFRTFQTLIVNELMSECNQRSFETSLWIISSTKKREMWTIISGFHVFVIRALSSFSWWVFFALGSQQVLLLLS